MMRLTLSLSDNPATTLVERAIMEFRSARPVVIDRAEGSALVIGVEDLDEARAAEIGAVAGGHAHLVLPAARLRRLGLEREAPGRVALPVVDGSRVEALALKVDGRIDAPVRATDALDEEALELARLSRFLQPVFAGDTLYATLEVVDLQPNRTTGVLTMRSTVHNQRGVLVMDGIQKYLISKRPTGDKAVGRAAD